MVIDNSNPFNVPEVRKQSFFKKPVPLWSLGAALIAGPLLTFGAITLADDGTTDARVNTDENSSAVPANLHSTAPSSTSTGQDDSPSSTDEGQNIFSVGELSTNHGIHLTVESVEIVSELGIKKEALEYLTDSEALTPDNDGAKFVRVNASITNESIKALHLSCGFDGFTVLMNSQGQEYTTVKNLYHLEGNPDCSDSIAPGFSGKASYVYEVPDNHELGYFVYADPSVSGATDNPTLIRLGESV
ncbi:MULTISPECIES: DUF4352 domain-containing protein [unclassified Corynebacterium]|uniref:DUF4352 domain-containing protein n=1 Tax=unclassified Corynebacterium TaxID=2624378 RepID=UPI0009F1E0FB|nr:MULTISPECIES: DUF4352 domain-containing protein [unclassified Corynebacterium]